MGRTAILLGLMAIAVIFVSWFSRTSTKRQQWLESLDLLGSWKQDTPPSDNEPLLFSFSGELNKGTYELRISDKIKTGEWKISQSSLILSDTSGGEISYEIRYFDKGKIGLHGGALERQMFSKQTDNIVPLRRP